MTHYLSIPRQIVRLYLKESDAGLEDGHREAEHGQDGEHVEGAAGEVAEVEHGVEQLISFIVNIEENTRDSQLTCAHPEENLPVSVVELHPVVTSGVNKLVAG